MELTLNSTVELNNGFKIPLLGLGTWELKKNDCVQAVQWAIEAGYRHIDTASFYQNEKQVGTAIKDSGISRNEIFVTSKVWDTEQGYENTLSAYEKSIKNLETDYLDLYLIHWPKKLRNETWKAMEKLLNEGKVRAIGVCNFSVHHLEELIEKSSTVPVINQIQITPFHFNVELINYCKKHNIAIEAYSPLTHGHELQNLKILKIGKTYGKSSAQILIRWGLQHDFIELPRSKNREHIFENADVFNFSLSKEDMTILDDFDEEFHILWDTNDWV